MLPGIASYKTIMANHCSEFIASPKARAGILPENPIHKDMLYAAKTAGLKFILNVVLNGDKEIIGSGCWPNSDQAARDYAMPCHLAKVFAAK